jgi:hypothetical protein
LNDIYLCGSCGLAFKPFVNTNPQKNVTNVYSPQSWEYERDSHLNRLVAIAEVAGKYVSYGDGDVLLDVGAGVGLLYDIVKDTIGKAKYVAVEPVFANALFLKQKHPKAIVLNTDINTAAMPSRTFKVAFVLGVDYLFTDIRQAFVNIANSLADEGIAMVQRAVFLEQTGYVGKRITTLRDIFEFNLIIRNWFLADQYRLFLEEFFDILDTLDDIQTFSDQDGQFNTFHKLYICKKKQGNIPAQTRSFLQDSLSQLKRLGFDPVNLASHAPTPIEGSGGQGTLRVSATP